MATNLAIDPALLGRALIASGEKTKKAEVTQDVDLWVRDVRDKGFLRALKEAGAAYIPQVGLNPPMLAGESARLFDLVSQMSGLGTFEDEFRDSVRIEVGGVAVQVLPLERIIASKEAANREKDRLVLPVLRDTAITLRALRQPKGKPRPHRNHP